MTDNDKERSPWVTIARPETFETDVFQQSHENAVIVDFWAEWCAPCRMLAPVLEKLANEYDGRFLLVKANTDEMPEAAARFQVQGIPAVFAVCDGEVVDAFQGAMPEPQIRSWLDQVLASRILAEAERLEETAVEAAEAKYRTVLIDDPKNARAKIGLARTLLALEQFEECQTILTELEGRGFLEPDAEKIRSALELLDKEGEDLDQRRADAEANPDDLALQLAYAESAAGASEYENALATCLAIIQKEKSGIGDQARKLMIDIFRVLPDDSDLTSIYRRKLSMALY